MMISKHTFGILMMAIGVVIVVRALTAEYLYNDTEGPIPQEQIREYKARPRDRLFGVCIGVLCIALGVANIIHR
jgi:hypothetical protein